MPKYRAKEKSFINNRIVEAGEEVEYDGDASDNLELVDATEGQAPAKSAGKKAATKQADPAADATEGQA